MPQVTIRTVFNGCEETLSGYLCDWPDCPNMAVEVLGVVRELGVYSVMCAEHARRAENQRRDYLPGHTPTA